MVQLDTDKKALGCALDEFQAHRFLEINNETLSVAQMRDKLREVGIEKIRTVPLIHFFIWRYQVNYHELVHCAQGDNAAEIKKAQKMVEDAQVAVTQSQQREQEAKIARRELEAALAEVKAQEDAYNSKTDDLKRKSEEGSVVQKNKAKNELAQHLGEDPLPLRKAKITLEAAVRKSERAEKAAEEARIAAEKSLEQAQAYLDEVKSKPGGGQGALWWLTRELHEARAYMPSSKGG